jgi:hypothetical protein
MSDEQPDYRVIKHVGNVPIVVASRKFFGKATKAGCIPFEESELLLMQANKVKLEEDSAIFIVKMTCPRAKLESLNVRR